jgi:homoserine kinase type II
MSAESTTAAGASAVAADAAKPAAGEGAANTKQRVGDAVAGSTSGTSALAGKAGGGRQTFKPFELAIVLSHYQTGVIEQIQEFPRGSRKAPKLLVRTADQLYLLKRRAKGKDDPYKVAFCHALQMHLAQRQFPLPHLIGTREDNNSMLQVQEHTYELFEYIKGTPYDSSLEATTDAGKVLSLFHKLLSDYKPEYDPPTGSYHASRSVDAAFEKAPQTLQRTGRGDPRALTPVLRELRADYRDAAGRVQSEGLPDWPAQIVHSDWHPGNMLFRGSRVVAVIDYDAARVQQRIIDAANGSLQFSILGGGDDPAQWPDYIDESRFKRFIRGYDSVPGSVLTRAELRTIPWLMIEALIAEAVIPIAATGQFGRMPGGPFLTMVQRKVRWLQDHADTLIEAVED